MTKIIDLTVEHLRNPLGIDNKTPRFGWKIISDQNNVIQKAYQIKAFCKDEIIWDSGLIESEESQNIIYQGLELKSRQEVEWYVELLIANKKVVSDKSTFEMGLLNEDDWSARWVQPETEIDFDSYKPSSRIRKSFTVIKKIKKARIYQTAHGLYEFWINGSLGTNDRFKPGITSYYHRIQYQTYDITELIREGENVWAIELGDGWWRGNTGGGNRNNYGFYTSFLGQLELEYYDGSTEIIGSGTDFKTMSGALLRCDMKVGEVYDARIEDEAWKRPGYIDEKWINVVLAKEYTGLAALISSRSVPIREKERFKGKVFRDSNNDLVIDFGQNHTGYVQMKFRNTTCGQRVCLQHGEGLKNGSFSIENLEATSNDPFQTIEYICRGAEKEEYKPKFAVFGYRYVKIEGYDEPIEEDDFVSIAVYSDLNCNGKFSCSNELINKLVSNSLWSQKSNFLDAPTDCPTRERSLWSGDGQVYCKTANDFMDAYTFYEKWMADLNVEQFEDGCVGNTFPSTNALHNPVERQRMLDQGRFVFAPPTMAGPEGCGDFMDGAAGWGDVATIVPYTLYLCHGDISILKRQYQSAKKWVEFERRNAKKPNPLYKDYEFYNNYTDGVLDAEYIYDTHFHWGEWLEPDAAENGGSQAFNPIEMAERGNPIVATAYLFYSNRIMGEIANWLGKYDEAKEYFEYANQVKRVYNKYLIKEDGTIIPYRQAAYARVLAFDLADEKKKLLVIKKLVEAVEHSNYTVNTGFLSTPFLLKELAKNGYKDHAYRLLEQTTFPSWLHPITLGATSILENWDGMDKYRASFNHYSYGAVCDFLFEYSAGIRYDKDNPGYKHIIIEPIIGGSLKYVSAEIETPYGVVISKWNKLGNQIEYEFSIPANTRATIILEGKEPVEVGSGKYILTQENKGGE